MSDVLPNAKRDAEDLSKVVNQTSGTVNNRTGTQITPLPVVIANAETQLNQALQSLGIEYPPIDYAAGLVIERITQSYSREGVIYINTDVDNYPITTTGNFDEHGWQIVQAINSATVVFNIPDVKALASAPKISGAQYSSRSFWPDLNLGGGLFVWNPTRPKSDHNGGTVIDPDKLSELGVVSDTDPFGAYFTASAEGLGCFELITDGTGTFPEWFGALANGSSDDTKPLVKAMQSAVEPRTLKLRKAIYSYGEHPDIPEGLTTFLDRVAVIGQGEGYSWTGDSGLSILRYIGPVNDNLAVFKASRGNILTNASNQRNYILKNVVLDGNGRAGFGLYSNYASNDSLFENVVAINCRVRGIQAVKCWYANYQNIIARLNYGDGMAFGMALGTEFGDTNGISIINPRAHSNGRKLPDETVASWESRRFSEVSNRVDVNFGIGIDRNHGVTLVNPVSEYNYGAGIYKSGLGDVRGFFSLGGYVERNCQDAITDGGSSEHYEVIHDAGSGDDRDCEFNGLWFNPDMSGRVGVFWIKGAPAASNRQNLVNIRNCPNVNLKKEHEQYWFDYTLPIDGSNLYESRHFQQGVYGTCLTLSDPRTTTQLNYGNITYDNTQTTDNFKAIDIYPRTGLNKALSIANNRTIPGSDDRATLGNASNRWSEVFSASGAINTSDGREKQQISNPSLSVLKAWGKVKFYMYKFNHSVEKKGDEARWHFGVIAQYVKEAFESEGLNPFDYGILCYDEWDDHITYNKYDEEGNGIGEPKVEIKAGNRYGIRYDEALALECAYIRARLDGQL